MYWITLYLPGAAGNDWHLTQTLVLTLIRFFQRNPALVIFYPLNYLPANIKGESACFDFHLISVEVNNFTIDEFHFCLCFCLCSSTFRPFWGVAPHKKKDIDAELSSFSLNGYHVETLDKLRLFWWLILTREPPLNKNCITNGIWFSILKLVKSCWILIISRSSPIECK